jgi:hypothetical protein
VFALSAASRVDLMLEQCRQFLQAALLLAVLELLSLDTQILLQSQLVQD